MKNWFTKILILGIGLLLFSFIISPDFSPKDSVNTDSCDCDVTRDSSALIDFYNSTNIPWDINQPMSEWVGIRLNEDGCVESFVLRFSDYVRLQGTFPKSFFLNLLCLKRISFSSSQITNVLPPEIGNLVALEEIDLIANKIYGVIPPEIGNLINLKILKLESNQLEGLIPPEIGNLSNLQELTLRRNNLSGEIPSEIGKLSNIKIINLNENNLEGEIPPEIGDLMTLEELHIEKNNLTGKLPTNIGKLKNLIQLSVSYNQLEGEIPNDWSGLIKLEGLGMYDNRLSGTIPKSFKELKKLESVSLGKNNFSLSILSDVSVLESLRSLSLIGNNLKGTIPESLGLMPELRTLYLSSNQLTGLIPKSLDNETIWSIYLSYNNIDTLPVFENWPNIDIEMNIITFDDLIPNFAYTDYGIDYVPQKPIFPDSLMIFNECESPIINLNIDKSITDNVYLWYKNGDSLTTTNSNQINLRDLFSEFEDYAGVYNCEVTNPIIQDLTLKTSEITIVIDTIPPIPESVFNEATICIGEAIEIAGRLFDCSTPNTIVAIPDSISGCPIMYRIQLNCVNCQNSNKLEIPTAFSPNGDGINETFIIPILIEQPDLQENSELLIYNQYGQLVYRKTGYKNEWSGKNNANEVLPIGTYHYVFTIENTTSQTGLVTLIR